MPFLTKLGRIYVWLLISSEQEEANRRIKNQQDLRVN